MSTLSELPKKIGRHTLLLICLLATMIGLPLLEHLPAGRILLSIWFLMTSAVLLASLSGRGRQHRILFVAGGIFFFLLLANLVIQAMGWSSAGIPLGLERLRMGSPSLRRRTPA